MAKKYGFSWSLKRASGFSGARQTLSKKTGIPTTKQGLERKVGASIIDFLLKMIFGK